MAVLIDWLIEGAVIYHQWWDTGTLNDARHVNQRTLELYQAYPDVQQIHTISNALDQRNTEVSLPSVRRIYTVLDHPQTGWILLAFKNPFLTFFANVAFKISANSQIHIHKNINDCFDELKDVDPNIDWNAADWSIIERFQDQMKR